MMSYKAQASSWLAPLQPLCLGREPKARVATVGMTVEPHENSNTLDLMDSSNPKFNGGFRSMWKLFL